MSQNATVATKGTARAHLDLPKEPKYHAPNARGASSRTLSRVTLELPVARPTSWVARTAATPSVLPRMPAAMGAKNWK